jgi:hypothetical protein
VAICDMDMVGLLCSGTPENTMTRDMVIDAMVDATATCSCTAARLRAVRKVLEMRAVGGGEK